MKTLWTLILLLSLPALAADKNVTDARRSFIQELAQSLNLKLERISDQDESVLGQWYLEGVQDKSCIGGFFYDFGANGQATQRSGLQDRYEIKDGVLRIRMNDGSAATVFKLSGAFYIPSRECGLAKLVRRPKLDVQPVKKAPDLTPCDSNSDCGLTKSGLCVSRKEGPLKWPEPNAISPHCVCQKEEFIQGCIKVGGKSQFDPASQKPPAHR